MDLKELEERVDDLVAEISGLVEALKKDVDSAFDPIVDKLKAISSAIADMPG